MKLSTKISWKIAARYAVKNNISLEQAAKIVADVLDILLAVFEEIGLSLGVMEDEG